MSEIGIDHAAELRRMSRKCIPSRGPWGDIPATMVQAATHIDELRDSLAAVTRERDEAADERDALRAEVKRLRDALEGASLALCAGAHGDNCYVDDYEFNRCICGKESALEAIDAALTPAEVKHDD
jgi:hypothetical protein